MPFLVAIKVPLILEGERRGGNTEAILRAQIQRIVSYYQSEYENEKKTIKPKIHLPPVKIACRISTNYENTYSIWPFTMFAQVLEGLLKFHVLPAGLPKGGEKVKTIKFQK